MTLIYYFSGGVGVGGVCVKNLTLPSLSQTCVNEWSCVKVICSCHNGPSCSLRLSHEMGGEEEEEEEEVSLSFINLRQIKLFTTIHGH